MNCFNHRASDAVGICKHCNKALCHDCLTDTGDGLACTATCVDDVRMLNALIVRNRKTISAQKSNAYLSSLFLGGMGAIFLAFGLSGVPNPSLPIAMGIGFVGFAILHGVRIRRWLLSVDRTNSSES